MQFWFKKGAWASKRASKKIDKLDSYTVQSIAVIRHAALGDMMLTRPFFLELKKVFHNASITISVLDHYTRGIPEDIVDRVHIVYKRDKHHHSIIEKIKNLRALGDHDIIFDLSDTSRSLLLCFLNKARLKIGFPYRTILRYLFYDATIPRSDFVFEADTMLHTLNLLGVKTAFPPEYHLPHQAHQSDQPYVVYFTGASVKNKCWSLVKFRKLILLMSKTFPDYSHIVLKGIGDTESISKVMQGLDQQENISKAEISELDKTISFIKGATLVVSNDTGIRHIAIATERPSIGIFFAEKDIILSVFRYWPRYGRHDVVYNADGTEPSVEKIFTVATRSMNHIQNLAYNPGK